MLVSCIVLGYPYLTVLENSVLLENDTSHQESNLHRKLSVEVMNTLNSSNIHALSWEKNQNKWCSTDSIFEDVQVDLRVLWICRSLRVAVPNLFCHLGNIVKLLKSHLMVSTVTNNLLLLIISKLTFSRLGWLFVYHRRSFLFHFVSALLYEINSQLTKAWASAET